MHTDDVLGRYTPTNKTNTKADTYATATSESPRVNGAAAVMEMIMAVAECNVKLGQPFQIGSRRRVLTKVNPVATDARD